MIIPCAAIAADDDGFNYDEAKVPKFILPDPLVMADGTKVDSEELWKGKRRGEILELFRDQMYGRMPARPVGMRFKVFEEDPNALGGKATRRQISVYFTESDEMEKSMDILLYVPNGAEKPVPVFFGLNFQGNHAVHADPGIRLSERWMDKGPGVENNRATAASRGAAASRWPVEMILERGYALATVYRGDIDPDYHDGFKNGVHALYPAMQGEGDNFSTVAAWAWGLSRILDYLETDERIDAKRAAVIGHSRLGKASLWAGAEDERIALVISNDSGCGGAALSKRHFGETVERINTSFPHWFCGNFKKYNENEAALPFDQHMLIALQAPRPVYVASAEGDQWADPRGEYLAASGASPVYALFDRKGLVADEWPAVGQPAQEGWIAYHIRTGKHDVTDFDWQGYLAFADKRMR
jgi:hypothetical protein